MATLGRRKDKIWFLAIKFNNGSSFVVVVVVVVAVVVYLLKEKLEQWHNCVKIV